MSEHVSGDLALDGAPNSRDLGGLPTTDGRVVRNGVALRAESLVSLTDADLDTLRRMGIRTVVDFRGASEIAVSGVGRLPDVDGAAPNRLQLPVFEPGHDIYTALALLVRGTDPAVVEREFGDGKAERLMLECYRWFVRDPGARLPFARTLRLLASRTDSPLLFHCTAGKDRTGWMAVVLLTALGVEPEAVVADYLRSNDHQVFDLEDPDGLDPRLVRPFLEVRPDYLSAAFDQIERDFGDFGGFLERGLGVDAATLERLRTHLLTERG
ncbi:MAG TPA: tyrosine-protein phosphatase [Actinopolymorphaceae bacterium]